MNMNQLTNIENIELNNIKNKKTSFKRKDIRDVTSMDKYINNIFDEETVEKLLKSEADIEAGRTRKAEDVINELRERFGF